MIKAVLIDDEPKLREVMKIKLGKNCPEVKVVGEAGNINDGQALIDQEKPQLVFLDISMPGGSGFDLLDRYAYIDFEIVFVTGFGEYAIQALRLSAVDYLLKPVNTEELKLAVQKVQERLAQKQNSGRYDVLKENLEKDTSQESKIALPSDNSYDFVKIADIIRCEGWEKYTRIHMTDRPTLVSSYNIGVFKEMLEPYGFFATHKSHLVNNERIVRYHKEGTVTMSDGSQVPVSRRRKDEFAEVFLRR